GTGSAGPVGEYECDTPVSSFLTGMKALAKKYPDPAAVVFTGDAQWHAHAGTYFREYDAQDVLDSVGIVASALSEAWPSSPILPVMGNHDNYPLDMLSVDDRGLEWLAEVSGQYKSNVPFLAQGSVMPDFEQGGYYKYDIEDTDISVIVLDSCLCDPMNFYALLDDGKQ
ncbi:hypothetical protein KIPB_011206, partial [Kipferlia bialata]